VEQGASFDGREVVKPANPTVELFERYENTIKRQAAESERLKGDRDLESQTVEELTKEVERQAALIERYRTDALDFHGQVNRLTEQCDRLVSHNNSLIDHRDGLIFDCERQAALLKMAKECLLPYAYRDNMIWDADAQELIAAIEENEHAQPK